MLSCASTIKRLALNLTQSLEAKRSKLIDVVGVSRSNCDSALSRNALERVHVRQSSKFLSLPLAERSFDSLSRGNALTARLSFFAIRAFPSRATPRSNRRGSALVEFTLALLLGAMLLNQVISFIDDRTKERAATLEARYLTDLAQAGRRLLMSQTQSLTIGTPVRLTAQDLATQGFLDEGRVHQSVTGRALSVVLLPRSANETVILARATPHAGETATPVTPKSGEGIARVGAIYTHAPDALRGPSLNYDLSWMTGGFGSAKPVVGDLAALDVFRRDQSITPYLHREAQASAPELNQMQTSLDMGGHDITGVAQLSVTSAEVTGQLNAGTLTGTTRVIGLLTVQSLTANSTATIEGTANVLGRITAPELIIRACSAERDSGFSN